MRRLAILSLLLWPVHAALGGMVISEWMYNGAGTSSAGEFVEFTNTGPAAIDMTGWSFDDDSRTPGTVSLSGFGVVAPGESVILTDETPANFVALWGLSGVKTIGGNTATLGRNDEINLYDAANNLVARLAYGDQTYTGTIRTQNRSCSIPTADYADTVVQTTWTLAAVGDAWKTQRSTRGELGSPGRVVAKTLADFNCDGHVDKTDFDALLPCITGPSVSYQGLSANCTLGQDSNGYLVADYDRDGDIDQADFATFQRCFSGSTDPADVACACPIENTAVTTIQLNTTSIAVTGTGVLVASTTATITSAGTYNISGTLTNGQIIVDSISPGIVQLVLNGINITNTTTAPIYVISAEETDLVLTSGTVNTVSDPATYVFPDSTQTEPNAAIFSQDTLKISGAGTLTVNAHYNDGIASEDELVISGGTINVNALDDSLRGKDYLQITGGNITVVAGGDALKSDNTADTALGYVNITNGTFNLTSGGDAITAETTTTISGGTFTIVSGGGSTATLAATASTKGVKGGTSVTITGGTFTINSADDGIHSSGAISIQNTATNIGITAGRDGIASDTTITIAGGTVGTTTGGGSSVTASDTISAKGIKGITGVTLTGGTITVNAADDGIHSNGSVSVPSGTPNVTVTTAKDGIYGASVSIAAGTFNVTAHGGSNYTVADTLSAKGIKGETSVAISGGSITLNVAEDGIHCDTNITISGGTVNISAHDDGIHAETALTISTGTVNITKCTEGLESFTITINSGTISVVASDDGINATKGTTSGGTEQNDGSYLYINGGSISITSTHDGVDSNGNIVMTGGTLVVQGPASAPEVGLDFNGTFTISGGVMLVSGPNSGNMIQAPSTSSAQYTVKATGTLAANTLFHIQNASGTDLVTFKPTKSTYYVLFSSASLTSGASYSIYTGGSYTGGSNVNGYYTGGTYSGGTFKKTFTLSSKVTAVTF